MFIKLNGHHLLHHKNPFMKLNVVLPLWDWILGTLIVRNKKPFDQAVGPLVPNVQPQQ
jgi:sterol desaturase/sphingolipid hydroxylase (fatty acid hydroxylase superfamily)